MSQPNNLHLGHWAKISEAGTLTGMRILLFCFKVGGRPLFKLALLPVIGYFYLFHHRTRRTSVAYLERVIHQGSLPASSSVYWLSICHLWSFANALIDKLAIWMGEIPNTQVLIHNDTLITDLIAKRQGAVLLISHLGNFEICRCLSGRHKNLRITVLVHTHHAPKFNRLMKELASESQLDIIQVTEITPATAMLLSERIEKGEFIAIAGDRVAVEHPENALIVDFLGEKAPLPIGPFTLAAILRAPLIALFCLREGEGYHLHFEQISEALQVPRRKRQAHLQALAESYAGKLEYHLCRHPLQWFNFFDFWQLPAAKPPEQGSPPATLSH